MAGAVPWRPAGLTQPVGGLTASALCPCLRGINPGHTALDGSFCRPLRCLPRVLHVRERERSHACARCTRTWVPALPCRPAVQPMAGAASSLLEGFFHLVLGAVFLVEPCSPACSTDIATPRKQHTRMAPLPSRSAACSLPVLSPLLPTDSWHRLAPISPPAAICPTTLPGKNNMQSFETPGRHAPRPPGCPTPSDRRPLATDACLLLDLSPAPAMPV